MTAKPATGLVLERVKKLDLTQALELHLGRAKDIDPELAAEQVRAGGTTEGSYSVPVVCGRGVTKPTRMRSPKPQ